MRRAGICPAENGCDPSDCNCGIRKLVCARPRRQAAGAVARCAWPCRQFRRLHPDQGPSGSRARRPRRLQGGAAFEGRRRAADTRLVARLPLARADGPDGGGADRQSGHCGGHRAVQTGRCAGANRGCCAVAHSQRQRLGELFPDFRLERTSAATNHVHVPASALDNPVRRQAARAALEQALARVSGVH